ncbi:hypothetical protein [Candidatus Accumulibacter sp. ACC003]|uniref:hypothetical protein n=1 Tax=Candidatus Accumulibacter sp. ACC003 TaxID=2823334 RepID=UPI0025BBD156|nr:hypothetical protein [Candidatus Accumulibacter sp. ACC003]
MSWPLAADEQAGDRVAPSQQVGGLSNEYPHRLDDVNRDAQQIALQDLPEETLAFLLGSRHCETDRLSTEAWRLFEHTPLGWARVQAICDFVHQRIRFGYQFACPTKTAWETDNERDAADVALLTTFGPSVLKSFFVRCDEVATAWCRGAAAMPGIIDLRRPGRQPPGGRQAAAAGLDGRRLAERRHRCRQRDGERNRQAPAGKIGDALGGIRDLQRAKRR